MLTVMAWVAIGGAGATMMAQPGTDALAPFLAGGGSAGAVAGLLYVVRLFLTRRLVVVEAAEAEQRLVDVTEQLAAALERVAELVERAGRREDELRELVRELASYLRPSPPPSRKS